MIILGESNARDAQPFADGKKRMGRKREERGREVGRASAEPCPLGGARRQGNQHVWEGIVGSCNAPASRRKRRRGLRGRGRRRRRGASGRVGLEGGRAERCLGWRRRRRPPQGRQQPCWWSRPTFCWIQRGPSCLSLLLRGFLGVRRWRKTNRS